MNSYLKLKVLVVPLDWGLGHATRCIPIIRALLGSGHEVLIGAERNQAVLLRQEFPQLKILPVKGYRISYSRTAIFFALKLAKQLPKIALAIRNEHHWLKKTVVQEKIDLVISDNRYGLYHASVPAVFITHQLTIKAPFQWLENIVRSINYRYINRFKACWVPDMETPPGIAGILSHPTVLPAIPVHYMNLLCRFVVRPLDTKYDLCILLSGPEPQRTLLEEKILTDITRLNGTVLLVRGLPAATTTPVVSANITVVNHLGNDLLGDAIQQSERVICRSGYTTVMELLALKKKMILVPTPAQTEQEYLGATLLQLKLALTIDQPAFKLTDAIGLADQFEYKESTVELFNEKKLLDLLQNLIS